MKIEDVKVGRKYIVATNKWFDKDEEIEVIRIDPLPPDGDTSMLILGRDAFGLTLWISPNDIEKSAICNPLKVLILGYKRAGKDFAAEYWRDNFGMTFKSSSMAAAEIFIFDLLMKKYDYASKEECYADRMNRRAEWFNLICDYNKDDKTRLGRAILSKTGAYIGMRSKEEVQACKEQNVFDIVIWIDAEERVGKESSDSCTVSKEDAYIIITNNGTEAEFKEKLNKVGKIIFKKLV